MIAISTESSAVTAGRRDVGAGGVGQYAAGRIDASPRCHVEPGAVAVQQLDVLDVRVICSVELGLGAAIPARAVERDSCPLADAQDRLPPNRPRDRRESDQAVSTACKSAVRPPRSARGRRRHDVTQAAHVPDANGDHPVGLNPSGHLRGSRPGSRLFRGISRKRTSQRPTSRLGVLGQQSTEPRNRRQSRFRCQQVPRRRRGHVRFGL